MKELELKYLQSLADQYPSISSASTEIINLAAILNLPKGTEHFLTDIHGEHEAFLHVLKNGSGSVRRKIDDVFGNTMSSQDKRSLATLIYYPREKMDLIIREEEDEKEREDWYKITLYRLIEVCKRVTSKYTRSKVRKALPKDFAYVMEELITEKADIDDKNSYYDAIVGSIITTGRAQAFIVAMSQLIQRLVVDHLHIVGDIYDRGPGPHIIMDHLMEHHSVDIQWGNHDVLWMGAAAGQTSCIANVIRICARYNNLDIIEDGYGINLLPLATFALQTYQDDPCSCFGLKGDVSYNSKEMEMNVKIHKAISIIQFKLEGQLIDQYPDFEMEDRNLLYMINQEEGSISIDGTTYTMKDQNFPTVDPDDPYALTEEEADIVLRLKRAFKNCGRLQNHMKFLLAKGGLYKVYNNNLLYHGCVLLDEDKSLKKIKLFGKVYTGKAWYDVLDSFIRQGFNAANREERHRGRDMMWYIWLHKNSPLFGKDKMATFERYFIAEKETHVERKNPYYTSLEDEQVVNSILNEFGLEKETAHIINGHVPVKTIEGESPIKCGGKVLVIDGGFARAYQKETGIAGYTLIYNSYGLILVAHEPFESTDAAIEKESDIHSESIIVKRVAERKRVGHTDNGKVMQDRINDLMLLLEAYRNGTIIEKID